MTDILVRDKILDREALAGEVARRRGLGQRMVFTNGCFDLIHVGHARYLDAARREGDYLVAAINADASVERLKGKGRPLLSASHRARVLASFAAVDYVTVFEEDDPIALLQLLKPEILIKGGDYGVNGVVGREVVEGFGGAVKTLALTEGTSTTNLIQRILKLG